MSKDSFQHLAPYESSDTPPAAVSREAARPPRFWNKYRVKGGLEAIPTRQGRRLFDTIIVSVDPATGEKKTSDLHGIVVLGLREEADGLNHVYVLAALSMRSPEASAWAKAAVKAYHALAPSAERIWIFAETNTGGSMVKSMIRTVDGSVRIKTKRARNSKADLRSSSGSSPARRVGTRGMTGRTRSAGPSTCTWCAAGRTPGQLAGMKRTSRGRRMTKRMLPSPDLSHRGRT